MEVVAFGLGVDRHADRVDADAQLQAVVDRVLLTRNDDAHLVVKARGGGVGGGWGRGGRGWAGWWAWPA